MNRGGSSMTHTTDVLKTYEFHVQIAEEDVRDGDATPWERVVAALAAEVRLLCEKLAAQEPDATLGRLVREGELLK
jgi:hypothetical protein